MLMGARFNLILPDFQVIDPRKFGQPFYVEVKTKAAPGWYGKHACHTHGIDTPKWQQYRRIHELSGLPVWLLMFEDMSGDLLGIEVDKVEPDHECGEVAAFPRGGTFWRRSQFALVAELERRQQRLAV